MGLGSQGDLGKPRQQDPSGSTAWIKKAFAEPSSALFSWTLFLILPKCLGEHNLPRSPSSTRIHRRKKKEAGKHVESPCLLLSLLLGGQVGGWPRRNQQSCSWPRLNLYCKSRGESALAKTILGSILIAHGSRCRDSGHTRLFLPTAVKASFLSSRTHVTFEVWAWLLVRVSRTNCSGHETLHPLPAVSFDRAALHLAHKRRS